MLSVDLGRLGREGSVLVEAQVSAEDGLWEDTGITWAGSVEVRLRASFAGSGEVIVRGTVSGGLRQECRRCLLPVVGEFHDELTLVFVPPATGKGDGEGGAFVFEPKSGGLDLSDAVREEVMLALNPYVVCDPECLGLCPRCGANLNEAACECTEDDSDPRWQALRVLKDR